MTLQPTFEEADSNGRLSRIFETGKGAKWLWGSLYLDSLVTARPESMWRPVELDDFIVYCHYHDFGLRLYRGLDYVPLAKLL